MHEDFTSPLRRINGRSNTGAFSARGSLIDAPTFFNRKLSSSTITTNEIINDVRFAILLLRVNQLLKKKCF